MKKIRRWLLMLAAATCLMAHAGALKAPSLLFKGTTTTSTTTTTEKSSTVDETSEESSSTATPDTNNGPTTSTGKKLTGIPQIDYIWDPNLPRELNGYNLSTYPFLNSIPASEDIEFKCGDKRDGFYASIQYHCQLYHHCLYGVRVDFLCANFTAFDQKTFICHFVSEVDCKNSAKYWFRNEPLYKATTTSSTTTTTTEAPPTTPTVRPLHRPGRPRRPYRRRRPEYYYDDEEYDDEYYEERVNRRRKQRPRPRRPEYDDYDSQRDYDEDERFDRRPVHNDRVRGKGEDDPDYDDDRRFERPRYRNRQNESRRPAYDEKRLSTDDRRFKDDDRRPLPSERRPPVEEGRYSTDRNHDRNVDERRSGFDERRNPNEERRFADDDRRPPINDRRKFNNERRPAFVENDSPIIRKPLRRDEEDRPYRRQPPSVEAPEEPVKVRPTGSGSGSLFAPRAPPKVRRPVPVGAREKYDYTTARPAASQNQAPFDDSEYYDDYEDILPPKSVPKETKNDKRVLPNNNHQREVRRPAQTPPPPPPPFNKDELNVKLRRPIATRDEDYYEDDYEDRPKPNLKRPPPTRPSNLRGNNKYGESEETIKDVDGVKQKSSPDRSNIRAPAPSSFRVNDGIRSRPKNNVEVERHQPKQEQLTNKENFRSEQRDGFLKSTIDQASDPVRPSSFQTKERNQFKTLNREVSQPEDKDSYTLVDKEFSQGTGSDLKQQPFRSSYDDSSRGRQEENNNKDHRPVIRVVKRPFLPSRGGSPYLPRGLQPVGGGHKEAVTDHSGNVDLESTVSGVRMLEHNPPLLRTNVDSKSYQPISPFGPRTTQAPQIDSPRSTLEEIYNSDYDVTLNDALNPTLKPLTPSRGPTAAFPANKFPDRSRFSNNQFPAPAPPPSAELNYSQSQNRPAIQPPPNQSSRRTQPEPIYDDEYDY